MLKSATQTIPRTEVSGKRGVKISSGTLVKLCLLVAVASAALACLSYY